MGSAQQKCDSSVSNTTETLKEDIMVVLLLPILCGVYSFLHWFILVPLLWTAFAHGNWNATSFLVYEIVAFFIWVAVIVLLLNMKCCKKKESSKPPIKNCKNSSSHVAPQFQTLTARVQPRDENLFHEPSLSQSGCNTEDGQVSISLYSIPVQPQCDPSSTTKKNMQKPAVIFSESPADIPDKNQLTHVSPAKQNVKSNPSHSSLLVAETADENLESRHCKENDSGDATSIKDVAIPDNNFSVNNDKHSQLSREESFVGLPEMNSFGSYLQLVTVDTPFSPSEQFFPDSVKKTDSDQTVQLNQSKEVNTLESKVLQIDQPASNEANTRSKMKDIPDDQNCNSNGGGSSSGNGDISGNSSIIPESGKDDQEVETGKRNSEKLTKDDDDDDDEVFASGAPVPHSKPKESLGECFIADVHKTESLTSEVFITVNEPSHQRNKGDIIHVNLPSDTLKHGIVNESNVSEEGRWAVLK